jgi:hypothetical protein
MVDKLWRKETAYTRPYDMYGYGKWENEKGYKAL